MRNFLCQFDVDLLSPTRRPTFYTPEKTTKKEGLNLLFYSRIVECTYLYDAKIAENIPIAMAASI